MLVLSTKVNDVVLLNITECLINEHPPKINEAANLIEIISSDKKSWNIRLRISNMLLNHGLVDHAKKIIHHIDTKVYVQGSINAGQVKLLLKVLTCIGQSGEVIKLLGTKKTIEILGEKALLNLKLDIAGNLIMQGQPQAAIEILKKINLDELINNDQVSMLGLSYMRLGMFDKVRKVFKRSEKFKQISSKLLLYKALMHICLNNIDQAEDCIDQQVLLNNINSSNQLWKAKLLNNKGEHIKALHYVDNILSKTAFDAAERCAWLIEKGNTLRLLLMDIASCVCYEKAQRTFHNTTYRIWIAYFEHAMTLIYQEKYDGAITVARNGCDCKSHMFSEKYNPCVILYNFLQYRKKRSFEFTVPPEQLTANAKLWAFPFLPHKMWMLLLIAILLKEQGESEKAKNLIYEIVMDAEIKNNLQQDYLLTHINTWCSNGFFNCLSSCVFVNDFNWRVIKQIIQ